MLRFCLRILGDLDGLQGMTMQRILMNKLMASPVATKAFVDLMIKLHLPVKFKQRGSIKAYQLDGRIQNGLDYTFLNSIYFDKDSTVVSLDKLLKKTDGRQFEKVLDFDDVFWKEPKPAPHEHEFNGDRTRVWEECHTLFVRAKENYQKDASLLPFSKTSPLRPLRAFMVQEDIERWDQEAEKEDEKDGAGLDVEVFVREDAVKDFLKKNGLSGIPVVSENGLSGLNENGNGVVSTLR